MSQHIAFFLSALVALLISDQVIGIMAAPFIPQPARNVIWVTSTIVASVEATVTDVVTAFNPPDDPASAPTPSSESPVTRWDTTTVTARPTETSGAAAATPTSWTLSEMFTDLSPLGINKLAYGSSNINIVTGIPASASSSRIPASVASVYPSSPTATSLPRPWTNTSSAYRVFYPSGSINPKNKPQGGAEFYATPGNLPFDTANNITLEYSVFFPDDFEWVQGGKLPGLYGGHEGCSGGNSARSCFSTRLMWRKGGAGELYLYAPKDKQTPELCNAPPQSVCDAAYGLSVGRGSFHFAAGEWTNVLQTVRLNTPGKQDGGFELLVNGQRIMRRDDVFYRDYRDVSPGQDSDDGSENDGGVRRRWRRESQAAMSVAYDDLPPPSPLAFQVEEISGKTPEKHAPVTPPAAVQGPASGTRVPTQGTETVILAATITSIPILSYAQPEAQIASQSGNGAVGFSGLFFSTFFGGHEQSWASPKDQYTWFKDFGMSINA